ncbi:MAG: lipopolysaccharide biosynthesis protein [Burkholderiales bacterium]|nr:lipopolysaccharide biosynthesis protein [Burkholderiales bacterium]MBW8892257.1 lipopolysaccharide biosynthesis protein [Burkholderiales bacterium]
MAAEPTTYVESQIGGGLAPLDIIFLCLRHWRLILGGAFIAGAIAGGGSYIVKPTFTARTSFLTPQQQQSNATAALASLGGLSGLAAAATGLKNPADQYVSLMESVSVTDRIIEQFKLMDVYNAKYVSQARKALAQHVRIAAGKRDGLISVEVDDEEPVRAADMANRYVEELRSLTGRLALTEAQQRRAFFEGQLHATRDRLQAAQQTLGASGFNASALKAEPKAAAEGYATLRAGVTTAEVRLEVLRKTLTDTAPEVQRQLATLASLRAQLAKVEVSAPASERPDYVSKYREYKYQETLFDLFARQYELAKLDESREGGLIQVVDRAAPPDRKTKPVRSVIAISTTAAAFFLLAMFVVLRERWRVVSSQPDFERRRLRWMSGTAANRTPRGAS